MAALVTGSLAFDSLIRIDGRFGDRWPVLADGGFSAAYVAPAQTRAVGGCAGNISYALHMLGETPMMMATAGSDFAPYADYLRALGIGTDHVLTLPDFYTAQAYMVTDADNNQFIVFHPGATAEAHRQRIAALPAAPSLAIVAPNGKAGMLQHCRDLAAARVPFIFDPGQAIGLFSGEEIVDCLSLASYAIFNQSEFEVALQATGLTRNEAAAMLEALFVTRGEDGSGVVAGGAGGADGETVEVGCVHLGETKDPTGCGDAYRAGLMFGLLRGWEWQTLLQFAAVVAAMKATHDGGQGYALSLDAAAAAHEKTMSAPLPL